MTKQEVLVGLTEHMGKKLDNINDKLIKINEGVLEMVDIMVDIELTIDKIDIILNKL